jgi:epoxyqueuosine reductase QueG
MLRKPPRELITIEDGVLMSMAANVTYLREFPLLTAVRQLSAHPVSRCGKCQKRTPTNTKVFTVAKAAIAALPPAKQQRLKALLNTKRLRLRWTDASGRTQERNL